MAFVDICLSLSPHGFFISAKLASRGRADRCRIDRSALWPSCRSSIAGNQGYLFWDDYQLHGFGHGALGGDSVG